MSKGESRIMKLMLLASEVRVREEYKAKSKGGLGWRCLASDECQGKE